MSTTWNPDLYLKFQRERTQPSIDLVSRIDLDSLGKIIDVGCGPGNSTKVLADRWPLSSITGVDTSEEMIAKAIHDYPDWSWIRADVRKLPSTPSYDLVYSNAAIQWVPDHEILIPRLFNMVKAPGAFAAQVPLFEGMPVRQAIAGVVESAPWRELVDDIDSLTFHDAGFYYDQLAPVSKNVSMWTTAYYHEMESYSTIVEMIKSTALRPYLEKIDTESNKQRFLEEVTRAVAALYPTQKNGRVLFAFNRLFFIAYS